MFSEQESYEFFVSRIKNQAKKEGNDLTDDEVKMLYFSVENENEEAMQLLEKYEKKIDQYENKMIRMLRDAYKVELSSCTNKEDAENIKNQYKEAAAKLREKDNYLTIMVERVVKPENIFSKMFNFLKK